MAVQVRVFENPPKYETTESLERPASRQVRMCVDEAPRASSMNKEPAVAPGGARSFWADLRAGLGGAEFDYTRGPLSRAVWLLAIPMMLEMAMESTFAVVDVFFVARLGDDAVAAV